MSQMECPDENIPLPAMPCELPLVGAYRFFDEKGDPDELSAAGRGISHAMLADHLQRGQRGLDHSDEYMLRVRVLRAAYVFFDRVRDAKRLCAGGRKLCLTWLRWTLLRRERGRKLR